MKIRTGGNVLTALIVAASISSAWAQGATQRPGGSLLVPVIRVGEVVTALPRAAMLPVGIRPLAAPVGLLPGGVSLKDAPVAEPAAVLGRLQTAAQAMTQAAQNGQTQEVSNHLSALYGEKGQADGGNGGIISIDMHYSILKRRIAERGVKAGVSLQSARARRGGGIWFVVELANTKDFAKIEDLFENTEGEWTYQQIPVQFSIATVKPSKQSSALPWPLELIDSFVEKHGDAIRDVPGVMEVKTGRVSSGGLAFLVITVADANDIAQVQKAVETQVPEVLPLHGVLGAPNQLIYEYGSAVSILPAPPHRDPVIIKQELKALQGSLIGQLKHPQVPHQGFLVDTIALDEMGAMPRLVITYRGSIDRLKDYVSKRHPEIALKGLPVEYVRSIAG